MSTEDNPVLLLVDGMEPVHIEDDTEDETRWSEELRLVLIGRTGSGKSASGNTILGRRQFLSQISASSVTQVCEQASTEISEGEEDEGPVTLKRKMRRVRRVQVVDMPGFGDTHLSVEQIHTEITKCVCLSAPGPHAFLLVVPLGRYTDCEDQAASELVKIFGEDALHHHTVVLFTRGDDLEGIEIEKYLNDTAPASLKALIDRCGGRYHVLNNRDPSNTAQVKELIVKVDTMQCDRGFYTNDMFLEAEAGIREEEKRMLNERGQAEGEKRKNEEIRREVSLSPNVLNKVKRVLTAGATGLAVGAMFGAAVPLAAATGASLVGSAVGLSAGQLAWISAAGVANVGKAVGTIVAAASGKTAVALGAATGGLLGGSVGAFAGAEAASPGVGARDALGQVSILGVSAVGVAAGVGIVLPIFTVVGSTAGATAAGTAATGTAAAGTAAAGTAATGTVAAGTAATGTVVAGTAATGTAAAGTAAAGTAAVGTATTGTTAAGTVTAGTAATGTAAAGTAATGTVAAGTAAVGTSTVGTAAAGTTAAGTVAAGTAATGTTAAGTAAAGTATAGTATAGTATVGTAAAGTATAGIAGTAITGIAITGVAKLLSNSLVVKVKKENDTEKSSYVIRWNK